MPKSCLYLEIYSSRPHHCYLFTGSNQIVTFKPSILLRDAVPLFWYFRLPKDDSRIGPQRAARLHETIKQLLTDDSRNLQSEHICKAVNLPTQHELLTLLVRSCILACLKSVNPTQKQVRLFTLDKEFEARDVFAPDLMHVCEEVANKRTPGNFSESCSLLDGKKPNY
ncbi:hypothetical protein MFRU_009g02160 [Monilinia fructicola]|nr:hypothetical protein MFRU_009g02160 [Monilinia fructicola]